ncbi:MAG TPA: hypothetical protein VG295_05950 [Solirubrobacteraceae bacterium]|nr:hypothetical protein [Solirubrobacteraceae bacterium]
MVFGFIACAWILLMVIAVVLCRIAGRSDDATPTVFVDDDLILTELSLRAADQPEPDEPAAVLPG